MIDEKVLSELKDRLVAEKAKVEKDLMSFSKKDAQTEGYHPDWPDYGDSMDDNAAEVTDYTNELGLDSELERILKGITGALEKMQAGTYGQCEICGQEIPAMRLQAMPMATRCVKCADKP